jgi:hypothetical protein
MRMRKDIKNLSQDCWFPAMIQIKHLLNGVITVIHVTVVPTHPVNKFKIYLRKMHVRGIGFGMLT